MWFLPSDGVCGFQLPPDDDDDAPDVPLLEAAVEVVIAGRSFPGTALSVAGRPIPVGPDGAFSLRISVPDGTREIPIEAAEEATGRRRRICLQLGRAVD